MNMTRIAPRRYLNRRRARRIPLVLGAAEALVVALAVALWFVVASTARGTGQAGGSAPAHSTSRAEWRAGEVPYLYQTDPQWAGHPYAGGTVEKNGCGPTCLSMVYVALTGRDDLDPSAMADFSERGGYTTDGMTAWALMTDGAAELGLVSEELPASTGAVREALLAGRPVICSVGPGDFTTTGHFIVLSRLTESGEVIVHDPNSAERSARPWDLERVLDQCLNLWAFSV
ncbi:C39 family peptidase [Thermophilibacter provencensis]|uniref:C39 family peptidase n=1 Tax=Thermophilibacter provencensis TaxID=1852386 RepID=A0ABT7V0G1_9ACTN|nr:C39 family peptidase [Thermophilibacter provencensis]MDM8270082.1 C39 family peptidase [Thermophilibacter provencensis]